MTRPTVDEVVTTLTPSPNGVPWREIDRGGEHHYWISFATNALPCITVRDADGVVMVSLDDSTEATVDAHWLVTRDGLPIDGDDTVTLDALPGLVRAALGLGAPTPVPTG